jgi:DNA replication protein DnaC
MSTTDDLVPILKKLRLSGILQSLELRCRQAVDENLGHEEFIYRLLNDEVERREAKQLALRLRRARFEHDKTLEDFDFTFNPKIPRTKVVDLATCTFVERQEVVLLVGPAGTGKSHLAQAIGHRACRLGHKVLFTPAHRMLADLRAARADRSYDRKLLRYTGPDLLIIDDLGLRPLREPEPEDLYEVIRHRYERGAMVMTSNRAVDEWYPMFGDALLASAAMDRLLHHAHVLELHGDSFRNPPPGRGRAPRGPAA